MTPVDFETWARAQLDDVESALSAWGQLHIEGRWTPPAWFAEAGPERFYPPDAL